MRLLTSLGGHAHKSPWAPLYALLSVVLSATASRVAGVKLASAASKGLAIATDQTNFESPFHFSSVHRT